MGEKKPTVQEIIIEADKKRDHPFYRPAPVREVCCEAMMATEGEDHNETCPMKNFNHPHHYGGDTVYEVIKVIEAWGLDNDAYLFNAIKYIARADKKGNLLEDLKKAKFYLDRRISNLEAEAK